jgi:rhomboid protease GluP
MVSPESSPAPAPVRLSVPQHRPIVTWLILGINIVLWILLELNGGSTNDDTLTRFGMKVNALVTTGEVWRLFTAMFLHIGLVHLAVNSYSLYNVGMGLERFIGPLRFVVLYLFAGLCGSLASYAFSPYASAGASGAIFGVLGALGVFFYLQRKLFGGARGVLMNIAVIAAINIAYGFSTRGIDNYAHLGGLLGGMAMGVVLAPQYRVVADSFGVPSVQAQTPPLRWLMAALLYVALFGATAFAMQQQSDSAEVHLLRGQQFYDAKQWTEATTELRQAVARDTQSIEGHFYLGISLFQQRQFDEAAVVFERTLTLQKDFPSARFNLALCYVELRRYADARSQLQQYLLLRGADRAKANDVLRSLEGK